MDQETTAGWSEETSRAFVDTGEVYTPRRGEMLATFLDLIPADPDDAFTGVELAPGAGWLTNGILSRFPQARMIGLDGSPAMLEATRSTLGANADRADLRLFRLEDPAWPDTLPDGLRCIVSSLAVHHLDHDAKRTLYKRLFDKLESGGALLILDVVEATSEPARRTYAHAWDADVRRQSIEFTESRDLWDQFVADKWNLYDYPDPGFDIPSPLIDHFLWLREAGFSGIDCFWSRAGHALYGGYRP